MSDDTGNTDGFMTTIVSPLADQRKKIFAMDCEMVFFFLTILPYLALVGEGGGEGWGVAAPPS